MIQDTSKFGLPFRNIYFETEENISKAVQARTGNVHIYSYDSLELPETFTHLRSTATIRIPVQGMDDDTLLASFRKTFRNEIRRSEEDSYSFHTRTAFSSKPAYLAYRAFEKVQGRTPYPYSHFKKLISFTAEEEGKVVSGVSCIDAMPVFKVFAIYSLRHEAGEDSVKLGRASKRVIYEACLYARDKGYSYVDLAYITEEPGKLSGIADFKSGFGGEKVVEHQYVATSGLVRLLRRMRSLIK